MSIIKLTIKIQKLFIKSIFILFYFKNNFYKIQKLSIKQVF